VSSTDPFAFGESAFGEGSFGNPGTPTSGGSAAITESSDTVSGSGTTVSTGVGSQADILNRLQRLQPPGWFAVGMVPIRDALLTGVANALAFIFSLFVYLRQQTRIATATDGFLDLISFDYFGNKLPRGNATDQSFKASIQANLFAKRNTRTAIIGVLTMVTGRTPILIEPGRAADVGSYDVGNCAYDTAGPYGATDFPYQSFVTAFRPLAGSPQFGITDADIYAAIEGVRLGASIVWTQILD
jgi:hypothetical protein